MAERIRYYGEHFNIVESEREYDEFVVHSQRTENQWGHDVTIAVDITIYHDSTSGLIVGDIAKFEQWTKANRLS